MRKARKKTVVVQAYRLGEDSRVLEEMIAEGEIKVRGDGRYEVFSRETGDKTGEIVHEGDYIKLDSSGSPYPNSAEFFEENHRHLAAEYYEQQSKPVEIWTYGDPPCPELRYLIEHGRLTIHEDDPEKYFQALLWGTELSADKDAVIVFYRIIKDEAGRITDADFNFVAGDEFRETYEILD